MRWAVGIGAMNLVVDVKASEPRVHAAHAP